LEPIHLDELMGAAGMSGFLGVLDPPAVAPHLSDASADLALAALSEQGKRLAVWFSNRMESLVGGMGRQQELLYGVTEVARRMSASAERIARRTTRFGLLKGEKSSGKQGNTPNSHPAECRCGPHLGGMDLPERKDGIAR
jgi:hypothetical protein